MFAYQMPCQHLITRINKYLKAIQSERVNRLADHDGLASHLEGQINIANQDNYGYKMTRQHQNRHTHSQS